MREFVYYSKSAVTAGNMIKDDLKAAGRMDIVCNVIIAAFFTSNAMREDVKFHLIFDGPPNAPRHLILESNSEMPISKKNVAGLIKKLLYKSPDKGGLLEIVPGSSIERKSFEHVIKELDKEGKDVLLLDGKGKDIREVGLSQRDDSGEPLRQPVFIIGDHEGFPSDKNKFLKKIDKISVGPKVLFASQVITILHNEIDRGSLS